jgi:hypothetical protein
LAGDCKDNHDCDDKLGCTDDICTPQKKCQNKLKPGYCAIAGVCYPENAVNPTQSCQVCNPATDPLVWTSFEDGTPCASDGVNCTADVCKSGTCAHELAAGWCLVNNICRKEGYSGSDPCLECVSAKSTSSLSFVAGKPCTSPAGQLGGMCWQNKCSAWLETTFDPKVVAPGATVSTALNGVAAISSAGNEVWAAGEYTANLVTGGVLVRLTAGGFSMPPVMAPQRFAGIHYRLAVGDGGQAYYHDGLLWAPHLKLQQALGSSDRQGVWGSGSSAGEVFWVSGFEGSGSAGMMRCSLGSFDPVVCLAQPGFQTGVQVGAVAGTSGGAAWALPFSGDEDIYYYAPGASSWTRNGPEGCEDMGSSLATPCSNTSGNFRDVFASGSDDVWAVGSSGLLMQYDGVKWVKLTGVFSYQSSYTLDAVFSSPADKLVTIAGHAASGGGRWVSLFNYNTELGRWFGPITLIPSSNNANDEIRDLGGIGYANLWAVGTRLVGTGTGNARMTGWILQLK